MKLDKLARLDINLLVVLKVVSEELSVTRAASRLSLSQSAVSKSLAKLREQFNDPLFIRTAHGLKPTSKTLFLIPKLETLVNQLIQINEPEEFEPGNSSRSFNIALVESAYPLILPHFLPSLFKQAPDLSLSTHNWTETTFKKLQTGDIDLGMTGKDVAPCDAALTMLPPSDIKEQEIYRDYQKCLVRKGHPCLSKKWDLEAYLSLRHIQVRCDGKDRWLLDYKLAEEGLERDIAITVPDFNHAANLCTYTDVVFTAPSHFTRLMAATYELEELALPIEFPPMAYTLFWHKDRYDDPGLQWLINIIREGTRQLR